MALFVVNRAPDLGQEFGRELLDIVGGFYVCGGLGEDFLFCFSMSFEGTSGDEVVAVQDFGHGSPLGMGAMVRGGDFCVNDDAAWMRNSRFPEGMTERKASATTKATATTCWDLWFPPLTQVRGQGWGSHFGGWGGKLGQVRVEFAVEIG